MNRRLIGTLTLAFVTCALAGSSGVAADAPTAAERGFDLLVNKAYLPPDFDQATFDELYLVWPEPLRTAAERATPEERRKLAYSRYGLTERPGDPRHRPLQYVVDERGNWVMNCLACHQGKVAGQFVRGAPNSLYALQTLTEELRLTKLRQGRSLSRMEIGALVMPLGTTNGTTNAVMFGVALMNYRDADLNVHPKRPAPQMTHHDHDAPAWWNVRHKQRLYSDDFAPKSHRALMQFLLVRENGPQQFHQWEAEFRDIQAYIESIPTPKYPFAIDRELAAEGERVFTTSCAKCHGTYGEAAQYPEKIIPIDVVGTDRVRLDALTPEHRRNYERSWFGQPDAGKAVTDPGGYVAPHLGGVWASAPYLHNGSVPTLWHVLHPAARPTVWQRSEDGYDTARVGLEVASFDDLPASVTLATERRTYFDTRVDGKSAAGHDFPETLSEPERRAVLEYLKTL